MRLAISGVDELGTRPKSDTYENSHSKKCISNIVRVSSRLRLLFDFRGTASERELLRAEILPSLECPLHRYRTDRPTLRPEAGHLSSDCCGFAQYNAAVSLRFAGPLRPLPLLTMKRCNSVEEGKQTVLFASETDLT